MTEDQWHSGRELRPFRVEAVLFDFDGTLTKPGGLDFAAMARAIGCPPGELELEYALALPAGGERERALATIERFELEAAARAQPNDGAEAAVRALRARGVRLGIVTRNGQAAIERSLERFADVRVGDFEVVVTRDDPGRPKPAPDGVLLAAERLGVAVERLMMVGDYYLDVQAGHAAGALTVYLSNGSPPACPEEADCDFAIGSLGELEGIVGLGLPLPQGKLPNELLGRHLQGLTTTDPAVLLGARVGEDVAALDVSSDDVLVVHGDPITLASEELGRYAVRINANDIATSGAEPRWFLSTVLLPAGTTPAEALSLLCDIAATCAELDIALVGGHTEITDVVTRPVVAGTMLATVTRADLRDKRRVAAGDRILLTKALAIEGTALLARELGDRLRELGMTEEELTVCRDLLAHVSVLDEARVARRFPGVRALHDVTEGGIATALAELSEACGRRVSVHRERIQALPETARVCQLLGADPLGLIASGSLLICCTPGETADLLGALRGADLEAAEIGEVGERGAGVDAFEDGRAAPWPRFAADEAARLLSSGERTRDGDR